LIHISHVREVDHLSVLMQTGNPIHLKILYRIKNIPEKLKQAGGNSSIQLKSLSLFSL
jgi:hypothetical protein